MDVKLVKMPTLAALQVAESIWEVWSNVHKPSKNRTYVAKKKFFGANFVAPKSSHQCEKQPTLGRAWEYQQKSKWKKHVQKTFRANIQIQPPDLLFLVVLY